MALIYYCKHTGLGFNGYCDCSWERRKRLRALWSQWWHRKRMRPYAALGFTPAPNETCEQFELRVESSLQQRYLT